MERLPRKIQFLGGYKRSDVKNKFKKYFLIIKDKKMENKKQNNYLNLRQLRKMASEKKIKYYGRLSRTELIQGLGLNEQAITKTFKCKKGIAHQCNQKKC